jgi:hypothetical protein
MHFDCIDQCQQVRDLTEPKEYAIIVGIRQGIQMFWFNCELKYNPIEYHVSGIRKENLEFDPNS